MADARTTRGGTRQRASHSLEAVVAGAVALLDEAGESALTFRSLAARLGGGVGSIYWYVSSKDELIARASDHVLTDVLAATESVTTAEDPVDALREMAVAFYRVIAPRPWLGAYFQRDSGLQPNGLRLYERMGQQAMRLDLTARQRFHAVSAVTGYVIGVASDLGRHPQDGAAQDLATFDREDTSRLDDAVEHWRALPEAEYPFVHHIVDEFATHDDEDVFVAGLDLLLDGICRQAGR
ncbi:transcriptional regulator, TetR family [Quadrisphaera granulorum]|uniref:TetR family transcriptional regulator n=1 Tax=Quadrisphaera granulorum TaxID=317664 RepID=A0A315ZUC7_9ACTN|nr:TetR/AcrR family transcriptional regulator [Quadrisphaera granulorum]PWJ48813.1 TetR family transcriptional regulator [Quadrisphaera granulorum]SZE98295.1 transcriptional regulator, TetR family [Quadrisphaera granulorum]